MKIKTELGRVYNLDTIAIEKLRAAKHAGEADTVFNELAAHIPRKDRLNVWFAV